MSTNNAVNLQSSDFILNGSWLFEGSLNSNTSSNLTLNSSAGTAQISANNSVTLSSSTSDIIFNTVTGSIQSTSYSFDISGTTDSSIITLNGDLSFGATTGDITLLTNSGDILLEAGSGSTLGSVFLISDIQDVSISAPSGEVTMDGNACVIGGATATGVYIGNPGTTTTFGGLQILSNLPGSPPGGSVAVLWDPISHQLFHG